MRVESSPCRCSQPGDEREQYRRVLSRWLINVHFMSFYFSAQLWTERAKGQTGDAADLKKRKRAGGGAESENRHAETDESSAKKKKPVDPSSKLSAFAFSKN